MISFAEYALEMQMIARKSREIAPEVVRAVGAVAVEEARSLIGQELSEWPPLKPSTVADKTRLGFVGRVSATDPLLRTGKLQQSFVSYTQYWGTRHATVLTSTDPKIVFHELGTQKMPPRPVLALAMYRVEPVGVEMLEKAVVELFA